MAGFEWRRASPAIPLPVGYPDRGKEGAIFCSPLDIGTGEVDWTLVALQTAAASLAGPGI